MNRHAAALTLAIFTAAAAQDESGEDPPPREERLTDLPLLETVERPRVDELLGESPVDWIVVSGDRLLKVEPVSVRPGLLEQIDRRVAEIKDRIGKDAREEVDARLAKATTIRVRLVGDFTGFAYDFDRNLADRIIYHEDHCLAEAGRLREAREMLPAWELLEHVRDRQPEWPGLEAETDRMILADAAVLTARGEAERSLAVLETLRERTPEFDGLQARYADAARSLALSAIDEGDFRQARHFRRRLMQAYPNNRAVALIADRLKAVATRALTAAERAEDPATRSDGVRLAARAWPDDRRLPRAFEQLVDPHPVLHAGVTQLAGPASHPLLETAANLRHESLTGERLFEPTAVEGDLVKYGSPYVERWRLTDLGRRAVVDLRGGGGEVDAFAIAAAVREAERGGGPYGDRWEAVFAGVRPVSPGRLELELAESPLRLDALLGRLDLPLRPAFERRPAAETPFRPREAVEEVRYVAVGDRPPKTPAEIVEHRFETAEQFGRAVRRDELDLAVDVPPHLVGRLQSEQWFSEEVTLGVCGLPVTHLIQFRPGSAASAEPMLRLGLARAMARNVILEDVFLNGEDDPWGPLPGQEFVRLTETPFPSGSYANSTAVPVREQDRPAAVAMGLLAKRRMRDAWDRLRMVCPDNPEIREAAGRLAGQWREVGFPVELLDAADVPAAVEAGEWDVAYRTVAVAEPALELWPLLSLEVEASLGGIAHLPEPMRRRLIALDRTDDWPSAVRSLHLLHEDLWERAMLIPLWEVDRLAIRRRGVRDAPLRPVGPYDDVTNWTADAAIPARED